METQIECSLCGDTLPGESLREACEDARNLGWDTRYNRAENGNQWRCSGCLDEEEAL